MEIELEKTYLLKYKPKDLDQVAHCEIFDIYWPKEEYHPVLRLRSRDNKKFEITKKFPMNGNDASEQEEHTINLSEKEFNVLSKIDGKKVRKIRYYYSLENGQKAEIDIFLDELSGLGMVDFEFETKEEKESFISPDFCLADVTHDKWMAGGMLAGGSYQEFEKFLAKYNYQKFV